METSLRNTIVMVIHRLNTIRVYHNTRGIDHWAKELDTARKELAELQRILVYLENVKE